jgi:5-formyltetrahydrofolate cyclo-ligase
MDVAGRSVADVAICTSLAQLADGQGAVTVLAYLSLADEVGIDGFLAEMVEQGREILLPRVVGRDDLRYGQWRPSSKLTRDEMGVLAPEPAPLRTWARGPSLVVVPGRAFDVRGGRVGRGRGYYDRILASRPSHCLLVGVAYECQVVEQVPRERHDQDIDCLVTEKVCRKFRREDGR